MEPPGMPVHREKSKNSLWFPRALQALGFREWRLWRQSRQTSIGPTWWADSRQVTLSLDEIFFHLTSSIGTGLTVDIRKFATFFWNSNLESKKYSPTIKMTKISINKICYSFDHISFKFKPLPKVISDYRTWLNYLVVACSSNAGSIIALFYF